MYARIPTVSVDNTVSRSIALKIIQDLKSNLSVFSKAFVALENIFAQDTFESGVGNISIDKNSLEIPIVEKLDAKIESRKPNGLTVTNFRNKGSNIFKNDSMSIDTEYINTELVISLEYKTKSKVNANKLVNMLKDHNVVRGSGFYHDVWYYYIIPDYLLKLMEDIVATKKINHDDNKSIIDFIKEGNILNVIALRSDINGLEGDVGLTAIGRSRIHGVFDSELSDIRAEHDKELSEWTVNLQYKTNFMSPESFLVDFEVVCNNTLLDPDEYLIEKQDNPDVRREKDDLYPFIMYSVPYNYDYVAIPPFDNHKPIVAKSKSSFPLMSILFLISPDDKKSMFNLKELEYYTLDNDVLDYIKRTKEHLTSEAKLYYKSIFKLDLYKNGILQPRNIMQIDDDLNVSAINDLDITGVYRCVLSIITNMSMIDPSYRKMVDIIDNNKLEVIYKGIPEKDIRVADVNIEKDIYPVGVWRMITAQTSIVQTFLKKGD